MGQDLPANAGEAINVSSIRGLERSLEKKMATHSSIPAWKIPWIKEGGRLQSMGSQRIKQDSTHTHRVIAIANIYCLLDSC